MTAYTLDSSILRAYDIRGIVGKTLTTDDARAVGRGFGTLIGRTDAPVVIGWDGRLSSPDFADAAVEGLVSCGHRVIRVGMGPTPMLYFSTKHLGAAAGIMITGSHNPPEYNGIKMLTASGPVYGDQIQEIGRLSATGDLLTGAGSVEDVPVADAYVERMVRDYDGTRPLKVAWDAGNGAVGAVLSDLTARLPGDPPPDV